MEQKSAMVRVGGLWVNEGKNGKYLSGNLNQMVKILAFPNTYKQKDSDPDYILYFAQNQPKDKPAPQAPGDDIPF